ncbi:MAG: DUF1592 domain-containing protein [Planctomycetes bacterium]|nr:DUF1592 domain-containing protein [Planctomycetota bacterium]
MSGLLSSLLLFLGNATVEPQSAPDDAYGRTIQPLLSKYCIKCHGAAAKPKADLNLAKYANETSVRADRKTWKGVLQKLAIHEMPPEEAKPPLESKDREALIRAIETALNKIDPNAPLNPGRVTVRRLNRTEYGNTIRDLVGLDFDPAEDFPSNDIGHGFDNIGDVLTLSPVLMERYLAAAETIVQRVFPAEPPKPMDKHTSAKYLEPAGNKVPQTKYRPVRAEKGDGITTGPLFSPYRLAADGDYLFKFRAYAKGKPVKVAVLACGKDVTGTASDAEIAKLSGSALQGLKPFRILETMEVPVSEEKDAKRFEVKISSVAGIDRLALALFKGAEGEPVLEVNVEGFVVTGPLDPRPAFQRQATASVAGKPKAEQARGIIKSFADRAFRRPVADTELARLLKLVEKVEAGGEKWEAGVQRALEAVLVSPKFLFRVELDDRPEMPQAHAINEYQLASRLSYFLWSTMPDDELFKLASKNELTANLDKQVGRMLKDPRARTLVDNFAMQWLQLKRIAFVAPDGGLFPAFNQRLRQAMLQETQMFLETVIREDRSILEFVDADYTFLNERLAQHYRIADTNGNRQGEKPAKPGGSPIRGDSFVRVSLQGGERGGLLTQASILTVTSNPTRTSPVKRGRWVLEQILGTPPPPPPPNVPELPETPQSQQSGSLRQRMEQHRTNPSCANCHTRMDAIGFALENFNAIGAWRTKDGAFEIDPGGTLPDGTTIKGVPDLKKAILAKKDAFARCVIEKMMIYALGRGMEPYDDRPLDKALAGVAKNNYKFSAVVAEIAKSDPFRLRRGKNVQD